MADLGSLYVNILPKYSNEFKAFATTLARGGITSGQQFTQGFNASMGKGFSSLSGIAIGAWTAIAQKGMQLISSTVDKAVSRVDTFYQFPKVMSAFGISAEDANKSIKKLNESVIGLPTALDEVTEITRALVPLFRNDIEKATQATMALNDAFVFSGSRGSLDEISFVMQRMITLQNVTMREWRPLSRTMGAALTVLAQDLYGASASSIDLYKALQTGKLSVNDFIKELIRMDQEGGKHIDAFKNTARTMTGGIQTSLANMKNAVARGIQAIFDTIGLENIKTFTANIGTSIENFLKQMGNVLKNLAPLFDLVAKNADKLVWVVVTGFGIKATKGISSFAKGIIKDMGGLFSFLKRLDFIKRFEKVFGGGDEMASSVKKWTKKLNPVKVEFGKLAGNFAKTGALAGIAIAEIGLLVVEVGAIVSGIGALSRISGVKELINDGINTLQVLFKGIGSILVEFVALAGVVAGFSVLTAIFNPATIFIGITSFAGAFASITTALGVIVAGYGALSRIPGLNDFINDGAKLIGNIFSVFGEIVGSITGALAGSFNKYWKSSEIEAQIIGVGSHIEELKDIITKITPALSVLNKSVGDVKNLQQFTDGFSNFIGSLERLLSLSDIGKTTDFGTTYYTTAQERIKQMLEALQGKDGIFQQLLEVKRLFEPFYNKEDFSTKTVEAITHISDQFLIIFRNLTSLFDTINNFKTVGVFDREAGKKLEDLKNTITYITAEFVKKDSIFSSLSNFANANLQIENIEASANKLNKLQNVFGALSSIGENIKKIVEIANYKTTSIDGKLKATSNFSAFTTIIKRIVKDIQALNSSMVGLPAFSGEQLSNVDKINSLGNFFVSIGQNLKNIVGLGITPEEATNITDTINRIKSLINDILGAGNNGWVGISINNDWLANIKDKIAPIIQQFLYVGGILKSIVGLGITQEEATNITDTINRIKSLINDIVGVNNTNWANVNNGTGVLGSVNEIITPLINKFKEIGNIIAGIPAQITNTQGNIISAITTLRTSMFDSAIWRDNTGIRAGDFFMLGIRDAIYNSGSVMNAIDNLKNLMAHAGFWNVGVFAGNEFMRGIHDALLNTITIDADINRIKDKTRSVEELTGNTQQNNSNNVYHINYNDYGIHSTGEDRLAQIVERVRC